MFGARFLITINLLIIQVVMLKKQLDKQVYSLGERFGLRHKFESHQFIHYLMLGKWMKSITKKVDSNGD